VSSGGHRTSQTLTGRTKRRGDLSVWIALALLAGAIAITVTTVLDQDDQVGLTLRQHLSLIDSGELVAAMRDRLNETVALAAWVSDCS